MVEDRAAIEAKIRRTKEHLLVSQIWTMNGMPLLLTAHRQFEQILKPLKMLQKKRTRIVSIRRQRQRVWIATRPWRRHKVATPRNASRCSKTSKIQNANVPNERICLGYSHSGSWLGFNDSATFILVSSSPWLVRHVFCSKTHMWTHVTRTRGHADTCSSHTWTRILQHWTCGHWLLSNTGGDCGACGI